MGQNVEEQQILPGKSKEDIAEGDHGKTLFASTPQKSPIQYVRPSSMVLKKTHTVIPAHLVAEAISTLHGLDLRWSSPITQTEMQFVEQYVFTKYPQYSNGLIDEDEEQPNHHKIDLCNISIIEENSSESPPDRKSPRNFSGGGGGGGRSESSSSSSSAYSSFYLSDLDRTQLEPSRLLDILTKKSSFPGSFISIPEIQAGNRALKHCGLLETEYLALFTPNYKDAMTMIGESYPFFKGNFYMTIINEEIDYIREFAGNRESKVISAPESWLDLRIKGSQLSQYFRRKCKNSPKGLFCYPADVNGMRYSMHWISEAHRNSWHVVLDATGLDLSTDRLTLALHRPDFVLCTVDNTHSQPLKITCLLVRRKSFDSIAC